MVTKSTADGPAATETFVKSWKDMVELARRLEADVASGRPCSGQHALILARAVLSRSGPPTAGEAGAPDA